MFLGLCADGSTQYVGNALTPPATGSKIEAITCGRVWHNSGVSSATYDYFAANATATPPSGPLLAGQAVELKTETLGGVIHYTLDGSTPDCTSPSTITDDGVTTPITQPTTIKTLVCKPGFTSSVQVDFTYTVQ